MTTMRQPLTDAELTRALTPPAGVQVPDGILALISAEIRVTDQRRLSVLRWPRPFAPAYPDQPNRLALALGLAILAAALLGAAVAASRLLAPSVPHGNGNINLVFRGGYIVVSPNGTDATLRSYPGIAGPAAAWSPRGDLVAFWGSPGKGGALVLEAPDGTVVARVDPSTQPGLPVMAPGGLTWSPDGSSLLLEGAVRGINHFYRVDIADPRFVDVTPAGVIGVAPAWSAHDEIAFLPGDTTQWGTGPWVMSARGQDAHPLLPGRDLPDGYKADWGTIQPAWFPDGERLLFGGEIVGTYRLYLVDRDGSGLLRIGSELANPDAAALSPDGRQILIENAIPGDRFDLYLAAADRPEPRRLFHDANLLGFSPDGTTILAATPSCDSFSRGGNSCDQGVVSIDAATGDVRTFLTVDQLDALGPRDQHKGVGGIYWQAVHR
jgi:hypothetical protein